jgi:hypothetical protein
MSETVIASSDVAPVKVPKSFKDLKKPELLQAAAYFGTDIEGANNVEEIRAALLEDAVTFDDYLEAFHPADKPVEEEKFVMPDPIDIEDWPDAPEGGDDVTVVTVTETPVLAPTEKYLIKFVGQNPYFEFGKYKFTQEKPYGIMTAADAQDALVSEPTKFRQAFPAELEEFYS